jgi:uncharacterized protein
MLHFEWDEVKNQSNVRKHGVDFDSATRVFDDPDHVMQQDSIENGELRWQTIGYVEGVALLLIAHTWVDVAGEEHIRIISARKAVKQERKLYEQQH